MYEATARASEPAVDTEPCVNCNGGYEYATHGWGSVRCTTCEGTGYIWRDACADGQCSDVIQVLDTCACNPPSSDDDFLRTHAVDCGKGPIDWVAMAERDRALNLERTVALRDLGEPPLIESYDLPSHLLG